MYSQERHVYRAMLVEAGEPSDAPPHDHLGGKLELSGERPRMAVDGRLFAVAALATFLLGIALGSSWGKPCDGIPQGGTANTAGVPCPTVTCPPAVRCGGAPSPAVAPPPAVGTEMAVAKVTFAVGATAPPVTPAALASALNVPSTGPVSTARAVITGAAQRDGVHYFVWDDDHNTQNNLKTQLSGIDELRECCAEFGLRAVRITDAEQVDGTLRPLLQAAGYDLSRGSGVALGMDYSADNSYSSLEDAGVAVSSVMADLHSSYGYTGDHQSDQTSDKQHLAGFGWAASESDVGVEDWGFHHSMQAVLCSDQPRQTAVAPRTAVDCAPTDPRADPAVGFDLANPAGRCGPAEARGSSAQRPVRTLYRICASLYAWVCLAFLYLVAELICAWLCSSVLLCASLHRGQQQ